MPLQQGADRKTIASNIAEFHQGQTYAETASKHGKAAADRQAIAVAMRMAEVAKKSGRKTLAGR